MVSIKQKLPGKKLNKIQKSSKVEKLKTKPSQLESKANIKDKIKEIDAKTVTVIQKNKTKYVMPSKSVTADLVMSCLGVLQTVAEQAKNKNAIFDDEKPIFAELHSLKIQNKPGNVKFVFPHSTVASTGEVCLITTDIKKGRKHDHEPTIDLWEEKLRKAGVTCVKTVLPLRQLKVEYDQFELKRRLMTQHDFIMVDTRVLSHASHLLGNMFFKKHNMLIPVRVYEEDLKRSIDVGMRTAMLRLNEGETSVVVVGHTCMPHEKVKDNILSLVEQLNTRFPGGEENIKSIAIKLPISVSLPIYLTLRPANTIKPPKLMHNRPKHHTILEDELSTMPGKTISVAPDGSVRVHNKRPNNESEDEEMDEEQSEQEVQESDHSE